MPRIDKRAADELRIQAMYPDFIKTAYGSCLIETGGTRVVCTASVDETVPPFLRGQGTWLADGRICHAAGVDRPPKAP